eukprot:GHRQ01014848.1.p1 GENE.GHRQ01014848.1~~GHRQ01014848.1.p1  ORF type:complete len:141 (-),score=33.27 GHRQ01014848.1:843-1265(-)
MHQPLTRHQAVAHTPAFASSITRLGAHRIVQHRHVKMAAHGRVFNFSAGPAMLPLEVLEQTQRDTLNFNGSGMSVMEMSHRSKAFEGIIKQAEADLRTLLSIPDNYKVLFVQGGASTQFAAIPLNFTQEGELHSPAARER